MQMNKADQRLFQKMTAIGNQVQTLTVKLLNPFFDHNINMELFFQDVADKVKQKEKEIEERRQEEKKRKREELEQRKRENEEQKKREVDEQKKFEVDEHKKRQDD
jgi:hypothetical protein